MRGLIGALRTSDRLSARSASSYLPVEVLVNSKLRDNLTNLFPKRSSQLYSQGFKSP